MYWVYQDLRPPALQGNSKFEILLVKIFCLKQKTSQILPATIEKIKFCFFKKTVYGYLKQWITIGKCKRKAIQTDLGNIHAHSDIFRYNQVHSGAIQAYSEPWHT